MEVMAKSYRSCNLLKLSQCCRKQEIIDSLFIKNHINCNSKALFTSKKFCKIGIVALSFVFDKYCPIID